MSFRFAWGMIKVSKGSDIANLASLEVLARVRRSENNTVLIKENLLPVLTSHIRNVQSC